MIARNLPAQRGRRGMATENILMVVLIAIVLLLFVTIFGNKISRLFKAGTESMDKGTAVTDAPILDSGAAPDLGIGDSTSPGGGSSGGGGGNSGGNPGTGSGTPGNPGGGGSPTSGGGGNPTTTSPGGGSGTGSTGGGGTSNPGPGGGTPNTGGGTGTGNPGGGSASNPTPGPTGPGGVTNPAPTGGGQNPAKPEESKWEVGGQGETKKDKPFAKNADGSNKFEKESTKVYRKGEGWKEKEKKPESNSKVEVGVEYTFHKKDRELKKYETEDEEKYKERKDLAKGRAGVRLGTLDTKVTGGAKWNPGSGEVYAGGSAGVTVTGVTAGAEGEVGNDYIKGKGSAEVVVGKVEAKVEAKIGNSKDYAGAKVEAGIGGSVVEGKVTGSVGSKWLGIEVEGELSGALLTAEAKGTAAAGYNKETKRFELELGGKVGALLAGGGGKVKIKLNKPGWWPW